MVNLKRKKRALYEIHIAVCLCGLSRCVCVPIKRSICTLHYKRALFTWKCKCIFLLFIYQRLLFLITHNTCFCLWTIQLYKVNQSWCARILLDIKLLFNLFSFIILIVVKFLRGCVQCLTSHQIANCFCLQCTFYSYCKC